MARDARLQKFPECGAMCFPGSCFQWLSCGRRSRYNIVRDLFSQGTERSRVDLRLRGGGGGVVVDRERLPFHINTAGIGAAKRVTLESELELLAS